MHQLNFLCEKHTKHLKKAINKRDQDKQLIVILQEVMKAFILCSRFLVSGLSVIHKMSLQNPLHTTVYLGMLNMLA